MENSYSCKIRNELAELSHIELLLYKSFYRCLIKKTESQLAEIPFNHNCRQTLEESFKHGLESIQSFKSYHHTCLAKCTDFLNLPSEELTCYDQCEEQYYHKLTKLKDSLSKYLQ